MIDAPKGALTPLRTPEIRSFRELPANTEAQAPEMDFSRTLETAVEQSASKPDTDSSNSKPIPLPRQESDVSGTHKPHSSRHSPAPVVATDTDPTQTSSVLSKPLPASISASKVVQTAVQQMPEDTDAYPSKTETDAETGETSNAEVGGAAGDTPFAAEATTTVQKWTLPLSQGSLKTEGGVTFDPTAGGPPGGSLPKSARLGRSGSDLPLAGETSYRRDGFAESADRRIFAMPQPDVSVPTASNPFSRLDPVQHASSFGITPVLSEKSTIQLTDTLPTWCLPAITSAGETAPSTPSDRLSLPLEASPGSPSFTDELGTDIQLMLRDGFGMAELSLNPVDLGPIYIELKMRDNVADISFSVANPVTREAIEKSLPELSDLLTTKGMTLGNSDVAGDSRGNPRSHEPNPDSTQTRRFDRRHDVEDVGTVSNHGQRRLQMMAAAYARGGIDHYA